MLTTVTLLFIVASVIAITMAVRAINSQSGTTGLRAAGGTSVDIQHDTADHKVKYKDDAGNVRSLVTEDGAYVDGFVAVTTATVTLAALTHGGRLTMLNRAGGVAVTLPAASGSGVKFTLGIGVALSAASHTIAVANASDYMRGLDFSKDDGTTSSVIAWATTNTGTVGTESDTITLDGSTKGGNIGDIIELTDIAANVWMVQMRTKSSGTEVTPFSAAV